MVAARVVGVVPPVAPVAAVDPSIVKPLLARSPHGLPSSVLLHAYTVWPPALPFGTLKDVENAPDALTVAAAR